MIGCRLIALGARELLEDDAKRRTGRLAPRVGGQEVAAGGERGADAGKERRRAAASPCDPRARAAADQNSARAAIRDVGSEEAERRAGEKGDGRNRRDRAHAASSCKSPR